MKNKLKLNELPLTSADWAGRFKGQTRLYFLISLILALVGAYFTYDYLKTKESNFNFTNVLVASNEIKKHELLSANNIKQEKLLKNKLPAGAITDFKDIEGQTSIVDISFGQIIVPQFFTNQSDPSSLSIDISQGYFAFPIGFNWFVSPVPALKVSDRIDIIASDVVKTKNEDGTTEGSSQTVILAQNIKILKVVKSATGGGNHLVLEVTTEDAESLMSAKALKLYLNIMLRPLNNE